MILGKNIRVTYMGKPYHINVDYIIRVTKDSNDRASITLADKETIVTDEPYIKVIEAIERTNCYSVMGKLTMTEQLWNQLLANLKFIENPDNYFSMFKYVIKSCVQAEFANGLLHASEVFDDHEYDENAKRISEAKQNAIKIHGEWTIKTLEESKTKHTVRTFVSTLYSDIFEIELK